MPEKFSISPVSFKGYLFLLIFCTGLQNLSGQNNDSLRYPDSISSGPVGIFHTQGIAIDFKNEVVYFSFTDRIAKTDFKGNTVGSVVGLTGHLGDLDVDQETGKVYASLELKDDEIGRAVSTSKDGDVVSSPVFYIAIFDGDDITRGNLKAVKDVPVKVIPLKEVATYYNSKILGTGGTDYQHLFGVSGIDGLTFGPAIGEPNEKGKYLYVACGIYGDTTRSDNDHQIILQYDISGWDNLIKDFIPENPVQPDSSYLRKKFVVYTGNTSYGIQNLKYDAFTGNFFAAVYPGKKSIFPNYSLFVIDGKTCKGEIVLKPGKNYRFNELRLISPENTETNAPPGWHYNWGATGFYPIGNGYFYISTDTIVGNNNLHQSVLKKFKWTGERDMPFILNYPQAGD